MIHIHEVLLTSEDEFSKNFNYVSKLHALAEHDPDKWQSEYELAKLSLEQGYPINQIKLPI